MLYKVYGDNIFLVLNEYTICGFEVSKMNKTDYFLMQYISIFSVF